MDALGADWVYAGERCAAYRVDDLTPALVAAPGSAEEVVAVLALANEAGAAVIPWGGGTAMALGYPPRAADLALDLRRLSQVVAYEPADLTLAVQAGVSFAALDAVLAAHGQRLALDCPRPETATLGGLVAANLSGPRRFRYGTARDALIGVRAAHPDGTLTRGGGMVVKNVSGYDMMKLYVGSLGTLAVIVELNFKLSPRPPADGTAVLSFAALDAALVAAESLLASQLLPCAVVVLDGVVAGGLGVRPSASGSPGTAGAALAARFEGAEVTTARQVREVCSRAGVWGAADARALAADAAATFWDGLLAFQTLDADPRNSALLKLSVVPSDLPAVMAGVAEVAGQVDLRCLQFADAGSGIIYLRVGQPEDALPAVFAWALWALQTELVRRWGQSVVLSCPTVAKENLPLWGREPAGLAVMRELKARFDPSGILNPGRYVGRI
ncbi:MAG TPA: FAD-binding oxidoreductase [Chloroflexota bacterium]|nr:FAD-binding oxidoreductase [Chloroflexota bacterium]